MKRAPTSSSTVVVALVAIVAIVAAAALFATGDQALERLAVLIGVVGLVLPSLTATLRADQAASSSHQAAEQTNGSLDTRIAEAVAAALQARRATDHVVVAQERRGQPPAADQPAGENVTSASQSDERLT